MSVQVLVVDDDVMVSLLHSKVVNLAGIETPPKVFYDGLKAFNHIKQKPQNSYLVLLDINMPVMDGWEFLDNISVEMPDIKLTVVIVTSSIDHSDKIKASTYPVIKEFIEKPLTVAKFKDFIESNPI